jgi:DNA-binding NarL/FixJ family response regulator
VWNETGASLDFSIAPAYWQTAWFRALCVAAILALFQGVPIKRARFSRIPSTRPAKRLLKGDRLCRGYAPPQSREVRVLALIAEGRANKEIAKRLSISEATVKGQVQNILSKLGAKDRTHAVVVGLKRGIIQL